MLISIRRIHDAVDIHCVDMGLAPGFRGPAALTERFEILGLLGDGAAGHVYKVRDRKNNNREMALKVLADELAFDEATLERFLQEIQLCQSIKHPNVVEAYDLIEMGDAVAYTMELVDGGSLQAMFAQKRIGYEAIERIMDQVLSAVVELHRVGIVHRDIKMENVLLRTDGMVKLTDLGLMKQIGTQGLTKPGLLLGTPQYMPPEYVRRSVYDERGDIYTLGLLLYELVSGKRWLSHLRGQEVISYLVKTRFEINRASLAGVPRKYVEILSRALDQDPNKRYQTAAEMLKAFEEPKTVVTPAVIAPPVPEIRGGVSLERYAQLAQSQAVTGSSVRQYVVPLALGLGLVIGVLFSVMAVARKSKVNAPPLAAPQSKSIDQQATGSEVKTRTLELKAKAADNQRAKVSESKVARNVTKQRGESAMPGR